MKKNAQKSVKIFQYMPLITSILFILLLLTNPVNSISLVNTGLTTWYKNMIPSLFPFMVLSGFLLRSGLSLQISAILNPILGKIFRLSPNCIYIIIMGFLCGFPMGANVVADSLRLKKITKREAELLLAFCNNIGPVYFISFVCVTCPYFSLWITMPIMYGIPLLYGLILRYTRYRDILYCTKNVIPNHFQYINKYDTYNYLDAFQESLQKAITSIVTLGAYMVVFNVLQLPLYNSFYKVPEKILCILKGLIEINSGISAIATFPELYMIVYTIFLPFCGLCCFFQTYAMIKDTPLSLRKYLLHKLLQTICTFLVYIVIVCAVRFNLYLLLSAIQN